ncbi:hypothetical protein HaLaN_12528 [Haematococcus lacustris]|uniref:Uncharacterized protein n=1 Tax=Haematococcus lacustris TaxID=44745 RepID=A0A699ZAK6_HAELA|nr:hypothetical protein HaLaN_12528 [Haematococcus lacustris]
MADTDHRTSLPASAPPTGQHPSFSFRAWSPGPAREPGRAAATQQGAEGLRRERSGGQLLFRGLRLKGKQGVPAPTVRSVPEAWNDQESDPWPGFDLHRHRPAPPVPVTAGAPTGFKSKSSSWAGSGQDLAASPVTGWMKVPPAVLTGLAVCDGPSMLEEGSFVRTSGLGPGQSSSRPRRTYSTLSLGSTDASNELRMLDRQPTCSNSTQPQANQLSQLQVSSFEQNSNMARAEAGLSFGEGTESQPVGLEAQQDPCLDADTRRWLTEPLVAVPMGLHKLRGVVEPVKLLHYSFANNDVLHHVRMMKPT